MTQHQAESALSGFLGLSGYLCSNILFFKIPVDEVIKDAHAVVVSLLCICLGILVKEVYEFFKTKDKSKVRPASWLFVISILLFGVSLFLH